MNKIRIGNQTAFSALIPMMPFEYAVDNGFNAFEWFPDKHESGQGWDESDIDSDMRSYIRDIARKHDIILSVHISLQADPRKPEKRGLIFKEIEFAQDIGAILLNIHFLTGDGIENYVEAIKPVIRQTAEAGIKLSIENTPFTGPEEFNELFAFINNLRGITTAHVGMCLDIGHANLHESTRNNYLRFIDRLEPHVPIIHIHAHENYGDCDSHLPFFTGSAGKDTSGVQGFVERMRKRDFSGSIILEQWPQPTFLLNEARDRLYHMFNSSG